MSDATRSERLDRLPVTPLHRRLGAWGAVYAATPEVYPTCVRATGDGWAAGYGRIASSSRRSAVEDTNGDLDGILSSARWSE